MKCPICDGTGQVWVDNGGNCGSPWEECEKCKGTGKIPDDVEKSEKTKD